MMAVETHMMEVKRIDVDVAVVLDRHSCCNIPVPPYLPLSLLLLLLIVVNKPMMMRILLVELADLDLEMMAGDAFVKKFEGRKKRICR